MNRKLALELFVGIGYWVFPFLVGWFLFDVHTKGTHQVYFAISLVGWVTTTWLTTKKLIS